MCSDSILTIYDELISGEKMGFYHRYAKNIRTVVMCGEENGRGLGE